MPDDVKKFCGNCYWYDADNDHRSIGWCVERKCKTGFFLASVKIINFN